jgi:superfamily I DNA/RNA helicase
MGNLAVATLIGGAGTGKTSELLRLMEGALPHLGHDPLRLGLASFTRKARSEAATRAAEAWGVDRRLLERDGWFRTIHSTCQRQLGVRQSQLLLDHRDGPWLEERLGVKMTPTVDIDQGRIQFNGDPSASLALNIWAYCRATLTPVAEQVKRVRRLDDAAPTIETVVRFVAKYETAKRLDDRLDFTDLLLRFAGVRADVKDGFERVEPEGHLPEVTAWLFDEQQDASPLLDLVCKRLVSAPSVKWCYLVGDPFQAIYGFAGSSADCFLGWPAQKRRTMPKSFRCPRAILELGERCLRRMGSGYFDRGIEPADHDGAVHELASLDEAVAAIDPRDSWVLLARTNYQARRMLGAMRTARKPARWCKAPEEESVESIGKRCLWQLQHGEAIPADQWRRVLDLLPSRSASGSRYLVHGAKAAWDREMKERPEHWDAILPSDILTVGGTETLAEMIRSGDWVRLVNRGEEWYGQARMYGPELTGRPSVSVGTIHGFKGGEADNVVLLTTTSGRIERGSSDDAMAADEEHRIAYVAVTRARRNLFVVRERWAGARIAEMEVL